MVSRKRLNIAVLILVLCLVITASGCKPEPLATELDEEIIYRTEGTLVGQIDNHSVEIEVEGIPKAFRLAEGLVINDLADGSRVEIAYLEADTDEAENGGDRRPLLLSIEAVDLPPEVIDLHGIYNGQIDSHSVEIEIAGEAQVFALDAGLKVDHLDSGTEVFITYRQEGQRQLLLSIEPVTGPVGDGDEVLVGEGLLIGLELMMDRWWSLNSMKLVCGRLSNRLRLLISRWKESLCTARWLVRLTANQLRSSIFRPLPLVVAFRLKELQMEKR